MRTKAWKASKGEDKGGGGGSKASKGEDEGGFEGFEGEDEGEFEDLEGERRGHLQSLTSLSFEERDPKMRSKKNKTRFGEGGI